MRKKHECRKGISPVIGVIILIALTVVAVGMVAVILSTYAPTGAGINAILALKKVENAYNAATPADSEMKIVLINWGPDDIISGSISIDIEGNYPAFTNNWKRGTAERIPDTGSNPPVTISWITSGNPGNLKAGMWPWKVGAGSELSIVLKGADAPNFEPTGLVVRDATTRTVLFRNTSLPSLSTPSIPPPPPTEAGVWVSSEDNTYKLTKVVNETVEPLDNSSVDYTFSIDPTVTYQSILGFGSSLESSSCYNLFRLDNSVREGVIENLVNPDVGIGMNLMRICIGTSDFTGENWYTYDDMPEGQTDPNLDNFTIAKDNDYIIPAVKIALAKNPNLKIFASPWSPPAWMKDSGSITGGGSLLEEYYGVYARYFVKFIKAYEAEGIPIYAVTVQNEPGFEWVHPTCKWTWENERDFVKNDLGPAFENNGISTKIWIYDWNFDLWGWPDNILDDPVAASYIDGTAFHLYAGDPTAMTYLHQNHPDKHIYFTEGATSGTTGALQIISYLRNWAESYVSWVTMLDENGNPNNGPFPSDPELKPIMLRNDMSLDYRYQYYMYGQFMKFIPRGAVRIFSDAGDSVVSNVAFKNPSSGEVVFVIANAGNSTKSFKIVYGGSMIKATIGPKSTATFKWTYS